MEIENNKKNRILMIRSSSAEFLIFEQQKRKRNRS